MSRSIYILAVAALVSACGNSAPSDGGEYVAEGTGGLFEDAEFDEDLAREEAAEVVSEQTFDEAGDTSTCLYDCSGHEAGFEWAKENELTDPDECDGNSDSFIEGCQAYGQAIERLVEEATADFESEY